MPEETKLHWYVCFYKSKRFEVQSDTTYHAQQKVAAENRIKDSWKISVMLADKGVVHDGAEL